MLSNRMPTSYRRTSPVQSYGARHSNVPRLLRAANQSVQYRNLPTSQVYRSPVEVPMSGGRSWARYSPRAIQGITNRGATMLRAAGPAALGLYFAEALLDAWLFPNQAGYNMGAWSKICESPSGPYTGYRVSTANPGLPCGLGFQPVTGPWGPGFPINIAAGVRWIAFGPASTRMTLAQQWLRPTTEATTLLYRAARPGAYLQTVTPEWPQWLDPLAMPIGVPVPTPRPVPYRLAPYVARTPPPYRSPVEGSHRGWDTWGDTSKQLNVVWPKPPGKKTKEAKFKGLRGGIAPILMNAATEGADFIEALFKALPEHSQRMWRWNGGGWELARAPTSFTKQAHRVYMHFSEIDWDTAVENLVYNHYEDKFFGAIGKRAAKANQAMGTRLQFGPAL